MAQSDDITHLDDIITTPIPEEVLQKHKDGLDNIKLPTEEYGSASILG